MGESGANAMNEMNDDADVSPTGGARPDIREVVRDLTGHLGPILVAVLSGDQEPGITGQWARGDGPAPAPLAESKLRPAHRVWAVLSAGETGEVARLWFLEVNPWLDGISPAEAIAQGRAQTVLCAAQAMIEDRYAGGAPPAPTGGVLSRGGRRGRRSRRGRR